MIDNKNIEDFIRSKIYLQEKLAEIGSIYVSSEIESTMKYVETRMLERVNQSIMHGIQEMDSLRAILMESLKPKKE